MGRRGPASNILYTRICRIAVTPEYRDLLAFFRALDQLPRGRRNAALLAAIREGATRAQPEAMAQKGSVRVEKAIDAIVSAFDD